MINIDRRNNISLDIGDNELLDFSLCGCDGLVPGDRVTFKCVEQTVVVTDFVAGVAKIQLEDKYEPFDGSYCIYVEKADGRRENVFKGKYTRKGGC